MVGIWKLQNSGQNKMNQNDMPYLTADNKLLEFLIIMGGF